MSVAKRPKTPLRLRLSSSALIVAVSLMAGTPAIADPATTSAADPAGTPPPTKYSSLPLDQLLDYLQSLYLKAEEATEKYNDAKVKLDHQRADVAKLGKRLASQHEAVRRSRQAAGRLARQQYRRGAGLSSYATFLLSKNPEQALDAGQLLSQAVKAQADAVERLTAHERELKTLTDRSKRALKQIEKLTKEQRQARDDVQGQLDQVEKITSALTGAQISDLQRLEQEGIDAAQATFLRSGALGSGARPPSQGGRRALSYAFAKLGKPYVWGAEGPNAFDCSGLTSQAWQHAGRTIPRTSQAQWRKLSKVTLNKLRPGDLVVYYPEATHVGMYAGAGMIIQAPRPGGYVKVSPIGAMPVLGAVRPDPEAASTSGYQAPQISKADSAPTPITADAK